MLATLLEATGSRVFQLCFNPVMTVVLRLPRLRAAMYAQPETNVVAYEALLAWARGESNDTTAMLDVLASRDVETLRRPETLRLETR